MGTSYSSPTEIESKHFTAHIASLPPNGMKGKNVAITGCTSGTGLIAANRQGLRAAGRVTRDDAEPRTFNKKKSLRLMTFLAPIAGVLHVCALFCLHSMVAFTLLQTLIRALSRELLKNLSSSNQGLAACRRRAQGPAGGRIGRHASEPRDVRPHVLRVHARSRRSPAR